MDILENFRGTYETRKAELEQQRNELVKQLSSFVPVNFMELLEACEEGELDHELEWVKVSDPRSDDHTPVLEVLPMVGIWWGETAEEARVPVPPGLSGMTLIGKLPSGEERIIGNIGEINTRNEPMLWLNNPTSHPTEISFTEWETSDAELFLKLAKSALDAQGSIN